MARNYPKSAGATPQKKRDSGARPPVAFGSAGASNGRLIAQPFCRKMPRIPEEANMIMTVNAWRIAGLAGWVLWVGAANVFSQTEAADPGTQPADTASVRGERNRIEGSLRELERTVADQRREQARLSKVVAELERQLAATQNRLQEAQDLLVSSGRRAAESESALVSLRHAADDLERRIAALGPEAAAAENQRIRSQKIVIQQRDREIAELRDALAARDALLKKQAGPAGAAPAAQPLPAPAKSAAVPAPAIPPAPARTEPARAGAPAAPMMPPQGSAKIVTPAPSSPSPAPAAASAPSAKPAARPAPAVEPVSVARQTLLDASRALREGRLEDAEELFQRALALSPGSVEARLGLAAGSYAQGDLVAAKSRVEEVLRLQPRNGQALGLAGIIAWREGDLRHASEQLELALRNSPQDAQLHSYMGTVMYARDNRPGAVRELLKAVQLNPALAEAHFNLAVILATDRHPNLEKAGEHYQAALEHGIARNTRLEQLLAR
jgi:tetratricopeptide (TPR) repeat protein